MEATKNGGSVMGATGTKTGRWAQVVVAVVAVAALVGVAACSSDGNDGGASTGSTGSTEASGSSTPAGGGSSRGVTDDSILVGGVAQVALYPGLEDGARARLERANRDGGVHGRSIELLPLKDDGSDPSANVSIVRELVQSDQVFAVLPVLSTVFLPQSSDFLAQQQVPFLGWGIMPGFCNNDWGFGFNGCLVNDDAPNPSLIKATVDALGEPASSLRFAFQAEDSPAGASGNAQFAELVEDIGGTVVYEQADIPTDQPVTDYTPYVQRILAAEPNVIYTSTSFANAVALAASLKAAGYTEAIVNLATYVPGLLEAQPEVAAGLDGVYVNTQIVPQESQSEAIRQIEADLDAIGVEPFVSLGAEIGYWAADVFVQMLEATGADLTPGAFEAAVNGGFEYVAPEGGIGDMSYPEAHTEPVPCAAVVRVEGDAYVQVQPMTCY